MDKQALRTKVHANMWGLVVFLVVVGVLSIALASILEHF